MARLTLAEKRTAAPREPVQQVRQMAVFYQGVAREAYLAEIKGAKVAAQEARLDALDLDPDLLIKKFGTWARSITRANAESWGALLGFPLQGDDLLSPLFPRWLQTNFDLITSLQGRARADARIAIESAVSRGLRVEQSGRQLQAILSGRLNISRSRAQLIARDQALTLNGQATRAFQLSAGVDEFEWLNSGDGRVRSEHQGLHGRKFRWDDPPEEGYPGEPILCRCTAFPVVRGIRTALN